MKLSLLLLIFTTTCFSQSAPPGIYLTYTFPKKSKCENVVKMLIGNTRVCISKKPILEIQEVESVSDILYDNIRKVAYINVGISSKAVQTLNKISGALSKSQFVIVLENNGVGLFTVTETIKNRIMQIGADVDLKNLQVIHSMLKRARQDNTNK